MSGDGWLSGDGRFMGGDCQNARGAFQLLTVQFIELWTEQSAVEKHPWRFDNLHPWNAHLHLTTHLHSYETPTKWGFW